MLTKLTLRNFQPHKKLTVDLDPGVTIIVGASDSGKSAIIRALRWLATNRPGGDAFIRQGSSNAIVTLEVDGRTVERAKGKDGNLYKLDGKTLAAFGSDVPDTVAKLLNMDDLNWQLQHDAPFWFSETAGGVSRQLNQVINLGIIDAVLGDLASRIRQTNSKLGVLTEQLEDLKERRERLRPIKETDKQLTAVEELEGKFVEFATCATTLRSLLENASRYKQAVERGTRFVTTAVSIAELGDQWVKIVGRADSVRNLLRTASILIPQAKQAATARKAAAGVDKLVKAHAGWQASFDAASLLRRSILVAKAHQKTAQEAEARAAKTQKEFESQIGKVCPLCQQSISK